MIHRHRYVLTIAALLVVSGCRGGENSTDATAAVAGPSSAQTERADAAPKISPNFLDIDRFPKNLLVSGGPPKDGIPALTDPTFVSPTSGGAGYLTDDDLVLGIYSNGEAKAYPHNIGWHHEIINDTVGGQPLVITLCPLTGTGLVFDGLGDSADRIELGVSGLLFNNNLVMYDRRDDETLYPQMIFTGIQGFRLGQALALQPVIETTWGYWKQLYPGTTVVSSGSRGAYSAARYRIYPYGDYRESGTGVMFPITPDPEENPAIGLYPPKEMVLGLRFGDKAKGYPFPELAAAGGVINDTFAGESILVVHDSEARLAVPYSRSLGQLELTFDKVASNVSPFPFLLKDRQTGSTWNLLGQGLSGPHKGWVLRQFPAHNAFWFAWATFWQNTDIYTAD